MTRITILLVVSLTLFVVSCSESKKESEKVRYKIREEQQNNLDTLNLKKTEILSKSYNAIVGWDTIRRFTYYLQELLENNPKPVSFTGLIKDITKRDSTYILKIGSSKLRYPRYFNAVVTVNSTMFRELKSQLYLNKGPKGCFIFQVSKITSNQPILDSDIESNGDNVEDASSYLTLDFEESLIILKGNLINYYLYDKLKIEHE